VSDGVRDRMVRSAVVQLAKHGVQGTSFAEVLAHANAPRGSVYHHFPNGKQELVAAAVDYMGTDGLAVLGGLDGSSADEIIRAFIAMWRDVLVRSDYTAGCSLTAVTVTSDSDDLVGRAATAFQRWQARLTSLLVSGAVAPKAADALATTMIAAAEGALVLARAQRSLEPLATVEQQLIALAATTPRARPAKANGARRITKHRG
jgi:TetR/AcrR family transcriptional regulator, lmrAB and yxaGH operons repressor